MKASELTNENISDYLRLEFTELSTGEKAYLTSILSIAKAFIKSYTGINDRTITGEELKVISTTEFKTEYSQVLSTGFKLYIDEIEQSTGFTVIYPSGQVKFATEPTGTVTADYTTGIDAFEEFVIVVYVLCQDMYDNRSMYVEKSNLNKVVDTILGMHCVNLL